MGFYITMFIHIGIVRDKEMFIHDEYRPYNSYILVHYTFKYSLKLYTNIFLNYSMKFKFVSVHEHLKIPPLAKEDRKLFYCYGA